MSYLTQTIINQMGGALRIYSATGGSIEELDDGIEITVARQSKGLCKVVKVTYDEGLDLYNMQGFRMWKKERKLFKEYKGVYCDQLQELFEQLTGYYIGAITVLNTDGVIVFSV